MTSFAFILGVVPRVIAKGAGAEMRQALGTAVFNGMLGVTFFGIFLTPVFYVVIRWLSKKGGSATETPPKSWGLFVIGNGLNVETPPEKSHSLLVHCFWQILAGMGRRAESLLRPNN